MRQSGPEEPDAEFTALLEAFHAAGERGDVEEQGRVGLEALVRATERAAANPTWWEVTAQFRQAQGDLSEAAAASSWSIELRRNVAAAPQLGGPYKHNSLAHALRRQSLLLLAAGETTAAGAAFMEAQSIRRAIGLPAFDAS